jgi:hypothetical protein
MYAPCLTMIRLLYSLNGKRYEEIVPFHLARLRNKQLFLQGAAVYWSGRC